MKSCKVLTDIMLLFQTQASSSLTFSLHPSPTKRSYHTLYHTCLSHLMLNLSVAPESSGIHTFLLTRSLMQIPFVLSISESLHHFNLCSDAVGSHIIISIPSVQSRESLRTVNQAALISDKVINSIFLVLHTPNILL